ncbi:Uncharacterized protein Nst1_164 [Candidatus Nanobsidianus stetteri]|uniref:Uncharacterized protein n=1 Tax=Nanobsidianus stetteri TaxID=1294122 RepID=R1GAD9_NANST|nr:Uncharacterized protein Nst1_164 [Candidatus Nanobsidianus stetteri]
MDELLARIHVKSYESNQPILQTVIENDSILSLLMKISKGQLSKNDIDLYYSTILYLIRQNFIIKENNGYYLKDNSKAIIEKIKYELELLKNINNENLDGIDTYSLLEFACENIVEINRSKKIKYPFSYIIFRHYNQQDPFTSYFIGRNGIILISLYSLSCKNRECYNWWYPPKQIKKFLFNDIPKCYDILRNKLDITPLVKFGLVYQRVGGNDRSRYKLSEEGYNVTKFILKNLESAIVYQQKFQ